MNFLQALLEKLHKQDEPAQDFGDGTEMNPTPTKVNLSHNGADVTASNGTSYNSNNAKSFEHYLDSLRPKEETGAFVDQTPYTAIKSEQPIARDPVSIVETPIEDNQKDEPVSIDTTPFVAPRYNSLQQLMGAQKAQQNTQLVNNLARIGQGFNESMNRTKFDRSALDAIDKQASQPVEAYQAGEKARKSDMDILRDMYKNADLEQQSDPNSDISVAGRKILEKMGFKFGPNVSMHDLQENTGISRLMGLKIRADEHAETLKVRKENAENASKEKEKVRQTASLDRDIRNMLAGAKGDKVLNDNITRANRLNNALQNLTVGGKISYQDLMDLQNIVIMNSGVTGQGTGHERIERLATSLGLTFDKYKQYLQGKVEDIGANDDILNRFQEIARREINGFNKIARNRVTSRLAGFESKLKDHPDRAADIDNYRNSVLAELPPDAETELNQSTRKPNTSLDERDMEAIQEAKRRLSIDPNDKTALKVLLLHTDVLK